ncbi:MAG: tetratricopeptide repeat protein, partial [Anaerolineales bacterium]
MQLRGEQLRMSGERGTNPWRIGFLVALIAIGLLLIRLRETEQIQPLFQATPTATRTANSFADEAETQVSAGNLRQAVAAYQNAVQVNPGDAQLWADLARVQTYYSALQSNQDARLARLAEARQSIERAVELAPEEPFVQAVRALVYDWSAGEYFSDNPSLFDEYLKEASESALRATELDPTSITVRAFQAEVLIDEGKYIQAYDLAEQASQDADQAGAGVDNDARIDAYRVFGLVLENNGSYRQAIDEYQKAIDINPNLTFLYLRMGANYRRLAGGAAANDVRENLIQQALDAFDRAAKINQQNGIEDPIPYLAIGRTYLQEGEFFVSARNVETAVTLDPGNPELYGFLGIVYYKGRNYESALPVLKCAVEGCDAQETGQMMCEDLQILLCSEDQEMASYGAAVPGLRLSSDSLEYYYTYASALAFLDYCAEAGPYFDQLMSAYGNDPTVAAIVQENRQICTDGGSPAPLPTSTPQEAM